MLRFVENPRDRISGFRVMQLMPGIGPSSAQRVLDRIAGAAEPLHTLQRANPPRAGDHWMSFIELVGDLCDGRAGWPTELGRARLWYEPRLDHGGRISFSSSRSPPATGRASNF